MTEPTNPALSTTSTQTQLTSDAKKSPTPSTTQSESSVPRIWVKAIFKRFAAMYGRRWQDSFPQSGNGESLEQILEVATDEWVAGLAGMGPKQISLALDVCRRESEWPPNIAQFRKAGGMGARDDCHGSAAYVPFDRCAAKPKVPLTPEARGELEQSAEAHIKKIREVLRKRGSWGGGLMPGVDGGPLGQGEFSDLRAGIQAFHQKNRKA